MMSRRTSLLLLFLSILTLSAAFYIGIPLTDTFSRIGRSYAAGDDSATSERLALINSAVRAVPRKHTFEYTGGFENPFKLWKSAQMYNRNAQRRTAKQPRTRLLLKGILLKDRPLAILENAAGETFIRGVGEKVLEQSIVSISDDRVTLRDHVGTYELIVEEQ
ncbi:MAG: hypothetical protein JW913_15190 [Chitinispirillaceae bacterium]|nr:hypothetical protein [Chitinispirillaceae bacterium]